MSVELRGRTVLIVGGPGGGPGRARRGGSTSDVIVQSIDLAVGSIGWQRTVDADSVDADSVDADSVPSMASALLERQGHDAICVLPFGDATRSDAWLESRHARGWIERPPSGFRSAEDLATMIDDALALGFVGADAVLLGCSNGGLARLSWGDERELAAVNDGAATRPAPYADSDDVDDAIDVVDVVDVAMHDRTIGLYAIVDSAAAVRRALDAGISTVQLRIKRPVDADAQWEAQLRLEAVSAFAATRDAGAELVLNDHWHLAAELGIAAVHLGQEDVERLGPGGRADIAASGIRLGISSHSVWELCRARALSTRYVACGPVWPTTTKDMPWIPQGPDNLSWWSRSAGRPVVAIGGILDPRQARIAARSGADGVCLVRALGDDPARVVPAFRDAFERGRAEREIALTRGAPWPHPTLPPRVAAPGVAGPNVAAPGVTAPSVAGEKH